MLLCFVYIYDTGDENPKSQEKMNFDIYKFSKNISMAFVLATELVKVKLSSWKNKIVFNIHPAGYYQLEFYKKTSSGYRKIRVKVEEFLTKFGFIKAGWYEPEIAITYCG